MLREHFDVLIIGAGLSGIGAAYHLQRDCPSKSYAILEGRENLGGTWDLFRYPGIRSDSDMYTLGYAFKPWTAQKAIADGPDILAYLHETANENQITKNIHFQHQVKSAAWSSKDSQWTLQVARRDGLEIAEYTCNFLFLCGGYYQYAAGYTPDFPGLDDFKGQVVHPQKWTNNIDYKDKKVVVIGSGATAVTLVPEMAKTAAHVTMLQRSPTYMLSRPAIDAFANRLRKVLPAKLAYDIVRWRNVLLTMFMFDRSKKSPERMKKYLINQIKKRMGKDYDVDTHFTPGYGPWDQRLCLVPDDDFFDALKNNSADIVTDHIDTFTATGITLKSGRQLEADMVVTATGLALEVFNGIALSVDGVAVEPAKTYMYKGMMYSDIPNMAVSFGYTNASWTLRSDLTCAYVCRLLKHMDATATRQCTPRLNDPSMGESAWFNLSSGYVQRAKGKLPKQGDKDPWMAPQNYLLDIKNLKFGKVDDGTMVFTAPTN
ncbi:MAG: NAD(P)/FAD-dependent oxidoreductase [Gammaproteobacteria bacterium]|nr:NAD(P)/FAD-dependent oxidoreductase [Gammaproteobacteria bacterium]MBQ0838173.1 NAD(P)/FAD-dependent oxidoreductase [Gammaproteobacteria bacterium]